jgi:hypothetical protein
VTESDETAQRIADKGRDALIARLRPAFEEAAAAHSDVLDLGPEQLDAMVMRAVDRADGLQWRRALASVASEELGISLGEALSHPAVARAQELAGAPSYEESLAELGPLPGSTAPVSDDTTREAGGEAPAEQGLGESGPDDEADSDSGEDEPAAAVLPGMDSNEAPDDVADAGGDDEASEVPEKLAEAADPVADADAAPRDGAPEEDERPATAEWERVAAAGSEIEPPTGPVEQADEPPVKAPVAASKAHEVPHDDAAHEDEEDFHGGPDATARFDVPGSFTEDDEHDAVPAHGDEEFDDEDYHSLRVAVVHLGGIANLAPAERDIELQMSEDGLDIVRGGREILGRLEWEQVKALEVPAARNRRRMRRGPPTHLVVRTARGDASFEVPEISPPELEQHLAPIVARHVRKR